jgi:hypothetical protein
MESSRIAQLESLKYDNQFIRIISSKITSLLNQFDVKFHFTFIIFIQNYNLVFQYSISFSFLQDYY